MFRQATLLLGFAVLLGAARLQQKTEENELLEESEFKKDVSVELAITILSALSVVLTWVIGLATGEYSQVDRIWSVTPFLIGWVIAGYAISDPDFDGRPRVLAMVAVMTLWGFRLTWNFWIKGGYKCGEGEDYRWEYVKTKWWLSPGGKLSKWRWEAFHFFFIILYQHALLIMVPLPAYIAYKYSSDVKFGVADVVFIAVWTFFWSCEVAADYSMLYFQREKYAIINAAKENGADPKKALEGTPYEAGFCERGLYRCSRHPNYFGELGMWLTIYLWGAIQSEKWINFSLTGFLIYVTIFAGSIPLTEEISVSKYPAYKDYQRRVSVLIPMCYKSRGGVQDGTPASSAGSHAKQQ